jgi:hypothetical protein
MMGVQRSLDKQPGRPPQNALLAAMAEMLAVRRSSVSEVAGC